MQRLTHFPASPLMSLSVYRDMNGGLVNRTADGPRWQPFGRPYPYSAARD